MEQPIEGLMKTTLENIKDMIDVNTVIGDPVETSDGTIIIPISKLGFAFLSGGGDVLGNNEDTSKSFAGGSGAGVTVNPIGFLSITNGQIRMIPANYNNPLDRIIDMLPRLIDKIENRKRKDEI
ncbi:GerW family sporulation protein [Lutispora thermophila]|uniref:Sporulation protein YtfJ n=1 Tax=Lutispora thermophila DSM 19022 TaxID=1122184 RepID=A0A1M6F782_9FIRM|nr:GerW family sporulation protein [Lutispora thermophila]SHI93516.1 sporulation protein YtfJ [Lutispora thermophila DSM 19022]